MVETLRVLSREQAGSTLGVARQDLHQLFRRILLTASALDERFFVEVNVIAPLSSDL
jgi:hypothetical protein